MDPLLGNVLSGGRNVALAFLRLTYAAADVFPPLKGTVGAALYITELVSVRSMFSGIIEMKIS